MILVARWPLRESHVGSASEASEEPGLRRSAIVSHTRIPSQATVNTAANANPSHASVLMRRAPFVAPPWVGLQRQALGSLPAGSSCWRRPGRYGQVSTRARP